MTIHGLKKTKAEECLSRSCDTVKMFPDAFNDDYVDLEILQPWNMTDYKDFIMITLESFWHVPERAVKIKKSDFIDINIF